MTTLEILAGIDAAHAILLSARQKLATGTMPPWRKVSHAMDYLSALAKAETVGILSPDLEESEVR